MSDKPLSEMTIRELVDEAYDAGTYGVELSPYLEEAARRDALADPELLTAAWLHGADHARRKARWPEPTDAVVEQLARAVSEPGWSDMLLDIHNAIVTMGTYAKPLESELVGLTTTQWDHERARRVAAAVLARLNRAAIGAEGEGNRDAD